MIGRFLCLIFGHKPQDRIEPIMGFKDQFIKFVPGFPSMKMEREISFELCDRCHSVIWQQNGGNHIILPEDKKTEGDL